MEPRHGHAYQPGTSVFYVTLTLSCFSLGSQNHRAEFNWISSSLPGFILILPRYLLIVNVYSGISEHLRALHQLPLRRTRWWPAPTVCLREVSALEGDEMTEVRQGPLHVSALEVSALTRCLLRGSVYACLFVVLISKLSFVFLSLFRTGPWRGKCH